MSDDEKVLPMPAADMGEPSGARRVVTEAAMPPRMPPSIERLECQLNLTYNWGYEKTRQDLRDLYKKAQRSQWNPDETLPWETSVDLEKPEYPEAMFPL